MPAKSGLPWKLLTDWRYFHIFAALLLAIDAVLTVVIVLKVPYTEIDWVAYMQEVQGWLGGEHDYLKLRGDTGPLVYPAVFVYLYAWLHDITGGGEDIRLAQWLFAGLYLTTTALVLFIYSRARVTPPWVAALLVLSRRIHSIFVLRLFNDGVAMALLYAAIALYISRHKLAGCVAFSLGVGVKMNVLLFAPGLLLLMLRGSGWAGTLLQLSVCAAVQLATGAPFLLTYPISYLSKAFELSRVFTYTWTVNWRFLSEETFVSKPLALALLVGHLGTLAILAWRWAAVVPAAQAGPRFRSLTATSCKPAPAPTPAPTRLRGRKSKLDTPSGGDHVVPAPSVPAAAPWGLALGEFEDSAAYQVMVLFLSNFAGVVFARTLHYQFYSWYWHTLPMLAYVAFGGVGGAAQGEGKQGTVQALTTLLAMAVALGGIEFAFNVFPSTVVSSLVLQVVHASLLAALVLGVSPSNFVLDVAAVNKAQ